MRVHEMKRSAQRAEGEIVSARDRGENRPALHWGHVKVNVFMQMSQSSEIVSKSTFLCAQKGQRGPKGVLFFQEAEVGCCEFARAGSKDRGR